MIDPTKPASVIFEAVCRTGGRSLALLTTHQLQELYWGFEVRQEGGPTFSMEDLISETSGRTSASGRVLPPWDLSPMYQRDSVWTEPQRSAFLAHWLAGGHVPPIVLNVPYTGLNNPEDTPDSPIVVIDGKQRIETVLMFARSEIAAEFPDGRRVYRADLASPWRPGLVSVRVNNPRRIQALLYLRMNGGGTPHTAADLERARAIAEGGQ